MTPFQAAYRKFKKLSSTEPGNNLSSEDIKTIFALSNHDYDGIDQPFLPTITYVRRQIKWAS
jgi:hypothetical protein